MSCNNSFIQSAGKNKKFRRSKNVTFKKSRYSYKGGVDPDEEQEQGEGQKQADVEQQIQADVEQKVKAIDSGEANAETLMDAAVDVKVSGVAKPVVVSNEDKYDRIINYAEEEILPCYIGTMKRYEPLYNLVKGVLRTSCELAENTCNASSTLKNKMSNFKSGVSTRASNGIKYVTSKIGSTRDKFSNIRSNISNISIPWKKGGSTKKYRKKKLNKRIRSKRTRKY